MTMSGNGPKLGELRRMQVVSTHGPGAVVDYLAARGGAVSGVTLGLDYWDIRECRGIVEPALQRLLGVRYLYEPPVSLSKSGEERMPALPAARFPEWLECPNCHELRHWKNWPEKNFGSATRVCRNQSCSKDPHNEVVVVPARFMVICERGHLADFPWMKWVSHKDDCKERGRLRLESEGAGLRNLFLRCTDCGNRTSMRNAVTDVAQVLKACPGTNPWLGGDAVESCDERPTSALRGSANIYFPKVVSVLTIPPWTDEFRELLADGGYWELLMNAREDLLEDEDREYYERTLSHIARRLAGGPTSAQVDIDAARKRIDAVLAAYDGLPVESSPDAEQALRREEWRQFRLGKNRATDRTFEVRDEGVPERLRPWFNAFARVSRLREVRALTGFSRRFPPDGIDPDKIARLSRTANWRPAMENLGEGIFLALNEEKVSEWANRKIVKDRAAVLHRYWVSYWRDRFKRQDDPPTRISPRRLLVHSLSHALILELSISCGYSAAALQERLYLEDDDSGFPMAGFLIYTASSDADGTLGGLEREGISHRLSTTLVSAIARMEWCSSDPLCMRGISTASDQMNGAACHSCLFVSETSCELFNRSLDRAVLIGSNDVPGYFEGVAKRY